MATASNLEIVFKGGTSLAKAFGLIERFSEDVDLLVIIPGSLGTGAADSKLKALVGGAATATGLTAETVANATSKGVKRGALASTIAKERPRVRTLGRSLSGDRITRWRYARHHDVRHVDSLPARSHGTRRLTGI